VRQKILVSTYNIMVQGLMGRLLFRLVILTLLLAGVACSQPDVVRTPPELDAASSASVDRPAPTGAPRIVFLGDSLTAGYGLAKEVSVPSLIQERLRGSGYPHEVVNAGVSGDTSAGGLSRLDWSLEGDVEILVLELGANDGLRGLPVASLKKNLSQIITRAQARGIRVVLTGMEAPPNFGAAYTSEFREVYRQLAREHDIIFVPFYLEGVAGIPSLNIEDGIHPNAEGSRIIEKTVWSALEPLLVKQTADRKNSRR
jgi:acyl-CoA thioesterase I